MTDLEKVSQWVMTYPGWSENEKLHIAYASDVPENAGLYPLGMKELSKQKDLFGNLTVRYRYSFVLYRIVTAYADQTENAQWLMDFQKWVYRQSYAGAVPRLGEGRTCFRAENGKLMRVSQAGTATFAVDLIAEFDACYAAH